MRIPTIEELRKEMNVLSLDPKDLAEILDVSLRSVYRMYESDSLKDRACIAYILNEINDEQHLISDFCECGEDQEKFFQESLQYDVCLLCNKKIKGEEKK